MISIKKNIQFAFWVLYFGEKYVWLGGTLRDFGKEGFFMKEKNNIWKRWWLGLAYFSPVLPLYRNHPINLLHTSVDWFIYNGNTGLNLKMDPWLKINTNF